MMLFPLFRLFLVLLVAGWTSTAFAQNVTWTFTGEITDGGVFSTLPVGTPWTLAIDFDPNQSGTSTGSFTEYTGNAVFTSAVGATDTLATIRIADAPNSLSIALEDAGATLPQLEFTNFPGQFGDVDRIRISLIYGDAGSEDLTDYLQLTLPTDPADRRIFVIVPSALSPNGVVTGLSVSGVPAVPTAALPWLLAPILVGFAGWRLRARPGDGAGAAV